MGLIRNLMRVFSGKKKKVADDLISTQSYWDGMKADLEGQVSKISERYKRAKATLIVKEEKVSKLAKLEKEMNLSAIEAKERYKESNLEKDLTLAKRAFDKMNEYKEQKLILESEIEELRKLVENLQKMKDNAQSVLRSKSAEIEKAKSRLEFSETMKTLTDGIKDLSTMELEGAEKIETDYHKNLMDLDEISDSIPEHKVVDNDFDKFLNS